MNGLLALAIAWVVTESPSDEVLKWNAVAVDSIRADKTAPPMASRNLAMLHVAVYDAVNSIDRRYTPFRWDFQPPQTISADTAAASAAHHVLVHLYPAQRTRLDGELADSLRRVPEGAFKANGIHLGRAVAERTVEWRRRDVLSSNLPRSIRTSPGRWRPTPPDFHEPLFPNWRNLATFGVTDRSAYRTPPPPDLASDEYTDCFRETKELGGADSESRTADQTEIARFWEDGVGTCTPPGHWNEIARGVAAARRLSIAENARLFAMLNISLADAAILCWDCKYRYDYWRPVTAIRDAEFDGNPATEPDADWTPLLSTPAFPAYSSGHSTFSGAAAAVLADVFGDQTEFATQSDSVPGATRRFTSFAAAANEAGRSRIYGGIHWECDNREGLVMGRAIGTFVSKQYLRERARPGIRATASATTAR